LHQISSTNQIPLRPKSSEQSKHWANPGYEVDIGLVNIY
jgi:hypothetical protein